MIQQAALSFSANTMMINHLVDQQEIIPKLF